ncbi:BolA family protein/stress-induced morphogen [Oryzomicrobium terrae]|uniref:BolA family protein/stress-induced morphogen n=1 Tax=Oryzomicrobium terrae TaxID=1735038 RepID=A0A5C1ECB4_9RHOO|nr:BolA/IbaG family iron-sulfur metabolism protein [Oryzomicrobium terrae]QEL65918.1 BolA family protein/stress-induced morphogen [Oryzomicrobium terrae]
MVRIEDLEAALKAGLPCQHLAVDGDGRHFQALIVSDAFKGLSRVRQHQLVYQTLGATMHDDLVHALALKTLTPDEWEAQRG